jgi:hypothetical protein
MLNRPFDELVTDAAIDALRELYTPHMGEHPLVSVALHPGAPQQHRQIAVNTCRALRHVLRNFPKWAQNLKPRLLAAKDWTNAQSALAELRACGALLEAGFPVQLGTKDASGAKPEFHVSVDGVETIVEVWTRSLSKEERDRIKAQQAASSRTEEVDGGTITTSVAATAPFATPDPSKKGDSVLTNVISKIAGIKEREHQAHDRRPFVLWIDLQSEALIFDYSHQLQPLMSWNGTVASGGYWHALYGRKGDVLLEFGGGRIRTNVMRHEGRYYQQMKKHGGPTRVSGCIFSSPKTTVMMEHPTAVFPLTASFRRQLINLPWFEIDLSLANWSDHLVERTVHLQREFIAAVVAALGLSAPRPPQSCLSRCIRHLRMWFGGTLGRPHNG